MDDVLQYYVPPEVKVSEDTHKLYDRPMLASRGSRLAAHLVDTVVGSGAAFVPFLVPIMMSGDSDDTDTVFLAGLIFAMTAVGVLMVLNMWWLHRDGQTVGKRLVGIRIVRSNLRDRVSLGRILGLRFLPLAVVGALIPFAALVDAMFIFGNERRCLHDLIADTAVVDAQTWQKSDMDFTSW